MQMIEKGDADTLSRFLAILFPNSDKILKDKNSITDTDTINITVHDGEILFEDPEINSEVLISACNRNNYSLVKCLVTVGYR